MRPEGSLSARMVHAPWVLLVLLTAHAPWEDLLCERPVYD